MSLPTDVLDAAIPPADPPALAALWHAHRGDWDRAHVLVQDAQGADAAWVHAHLHRLEGDEGNAGYWYHRAGRAVATGDSPPSASRWQRLWRASDRRLSIAHGIAYS